MKLISGKSISISTDRSEIVQSIEKYTAMLIDANEELKMYDALYCGSTGCENTAIGRTYCNDHVAAFLNGE